MVSVSNRGLKTTDHILHLRLDVLLVTFQLLSYHLLAHIRIGSVDVTHFMFLVYVFPNAIKLADN